MYVRIVYKWVKWLIWILKTTIKFTGFWVFQNSAWKLSKFQVLNLFQKHSVLNMTIDCSLNYKFLVQYRTIAIWMSKLNQKIFSVHNMFWTCNFHVSTELLIQWTICHYIVGELIQEWVLLKKIYQCYYLLVYFPLIARQ